MDIVTLKKGNTPTFLGIPTSRNWICFSFHGSLLKNYHVLDYRITNIQLVIDWDQVQILTYLPIRNRRKRVHNENWDMRMTNHRHSSDVVIHKAGFLLFVYSIIIILMLLWRRVLFALILMKISRNLDVVQALVCSTCECDLLPVLWRKGWY